MSLIQQESVDEVMVDFGNNATITFKMKADAVTVDTARRMAAESRKAAFVENRIKRLEKRVEDDGMDSVEFSRVMKELEDLGKYTDQLGLMAQYIMTCSSGWKDYFLTAEDESAGKVIPFTKETIEKINPMRLAKIIEAFNGYFGYEADESKKLSGNSPSGLLIQAQE